MAKLDFLHYPRAGYFLFYNLDHAVGKGCLNRRDDVLLAQYLLMGASQKVPGLIALYSDAISITGTWNDDWDGFLDYYQREWKRRGAATWADRRIDPVPSHASKTPVHHMQYFIVTLNQLYGDLRGSDYPKMSEAADCPAELRPFIRVFWLSQEWSRWLPSSTAGVSHPQPVR